MTSLEQKFPEIQPVDQNYAELARQKIAGLTMPYWAMGRICDLAVQLAAITRSLTPAVKEKIIAVFGADHGVVASGVSPSPKSVTQLMIRNFLNRGAGINSCAEVTNAVLAVVDVGVDSDLSDLIGIPGFFDRKIAPGTDNIDNFPAMTNEQALAAIFIGFDFACRVSGLTPPDALYQNEIYSKIQDRAKSNKENYLFPKSWATNNSLSAVSLANKADATAASNHNFASDLLVTGEMGIANTTISSAITACVTKAPVETVTGRGCGLDDAGMAKKIAIIKNALVRLQPDPENGLDILTKIGGFEVAAMTGFYLGASYCQKPVVIDGFICTAAAYLAQLICPASLGYFIPGHRSVEPGQRLLYEMMELTPLLDLNLRLGEGSGAALALPLIETAGHILTEMASFDSTAIEKYDPRFTTTSKKKLLDE